MHSKTQSVDLEIFHGQQGALPTLIGSQGQTNFVRMQTTQSPLFVGAQCIISEEHLAKKVVRLPPITLMFAYKIPL